MNKKIGVIIVLSVTVMFLIWTRHDSFNSFKEAIVPPAQRYFNPSVEEKLPPTVKEAIIPSGQRFSNPSMEEKLSPIDAIIRDCGELCDTNRPGSPGPFFDHIKAKVDCEALFKNDYIDRGHGLQNAPKEIPKELRSAYSMNNRVHIGNLYFSQQYLGSKALTPKWSFDRIENDVKRARNGTLHGTYGPGETNALRDGLKHASGVKDGRVLVIGSEMPWVEACALEAGAREVVTLEYGKIISEHPKVKTILPYDFRMMYLNKTLGTFDAIATFSSVEHSGLGRYGDALNPWGDIIAIARAWCVTRTGGSLTIGVMYGGKSDSLAFNAHRVYGKLRYPYLTTNWKQVYLGKGYQKVHVFSKE